MNRHVPEDVTIFFVKISKCAFGDPKVNTFSQLKQTLSYPTCFSKGHLEWYNYPNCHHFFTFAFSLNLSFSLKNSTFIRNLKCSGDFVTRKQERYELCLQNLHKKMASYFGMSSQSYSYNSNDSNLDNLVKRSIRDKEASPISSDHSEGVRNLMRRLHQILSQGVLLVTMVRMIMRKMMPKKMM